MTLGLYLHFPWCVRKCPYCDFNSHPVRGTLQEDAYREAVMLDLEQALADVQPATIDTVFCGGGTPSLFSPATFRVLLERATPWLRSEAEITLEANPGTVEHHDFRAYREAGINRLSLGAQSFDAGKLERLGRIHGPEDTVRAVQKARAAGFENLNLDLMYALPDQTLEQALTDLRRAVELQPEHLSWYQLTLEPKTEFARRPPALPGHDETADFERAGLELLAAAGYRRYEISAFARPGFECRHNVNYWRFGDYLGVGAGAHGKRSRQQDGRLVVERTRKLSQPRLYLEDPRQTVRTKVPPEELPFEFLMNALRLVDGVCPTSFEQRTGLSPRVIASRWSTLAEAGLVHGGRLAATDTGLRYLDSVLERFLR